jgi:hypothetical protein
MSSRIYARKNTDASLPVLGLTGRPFSNLQTKMTVGMPNDKYEQEADRVAEQVTDSLQRQESGEEEEVMMKPINSGFLQKKGGGMAEDEEMQMKSDGEHGGVNPAIEQTINQKRGGGSAIPDIFRSKLEQAIGADFTGVRVHNDSTADMLNRSISARAFTSGQDIFFKQGEYNPSSSEGQKLLAHELTHTVQQNPQLAQKKSLKS